MAELLTVLFLTLVVFVMVAQVLVPSLSLFRVQSARSDVQQGPLILVHYVQKAMLNTSVDTITYTDSPVAISWVEVTEADPYDGVKGTPKLAPRFSILYYERSDGRIYTKHWPPSPPASPLVGTYDFAAAKEPLALTEKDLRTICATTNGTERVLVKDVRSLQIKDGADVPASHGTMVLPIKVAVCCEVATGKPSSGEPLVESFALDVQVTPRSMRW